MLKGEKQKGPIRLEGVTLAIAELSGGGRKRKER
jgi:hypothetical protein